MFNKKIIVSTVSVFVTMMAYGFLVYGLALDNFYKEYAGNLAIRAEGEELMHWLAVGQLLMAYGFVWVWHHGVKGTGIAEGLRFGFAMGIFWGGVEMINYAFMPMDLIAMVVSYVADIAMMMVAGVVLSIVWGKLSD